MGRVQEQTGTVLSNLDSNNLSRAGLLGDSGSHKKTGVRLATIGTHRSTRRIVGLLPHDPQIITKVKRGT